MVTDPQQQAMPPLPESVGFRTRYRSEPGMIGHYPWTYADQRRRRPNRPTDESEDLFTADQMRAYAAEAVASALAASAPVWTPGAGDGPKSQEDFGKWLSHNDKCMGLPGAGEAASAPGCVVPEGWKIEVTGPNGSARLEGPEGAAHYGAESFHFRDRLVFAFLKAMAASPSVAEAGEKKP